MAEDAGFNSVKVRAQSWPSKGTWGGVRVLLDFSEPAADLREQTELLQADTSVRSVCSM